jgi:hypothetical protein
MFIQVDNMSKTKAPLTEGTAFLVPLRNGEYARGVVTRTDPHGEILFGYFFGPRIDSNIGVNVDDLNPATSLLRILFGALGLRDGKWPIIGQISKWERSDWPMPDFIRRDPLNRRKPRLVRYSDRDPSIEREYVVDDDPQLAAASLFGYGAVEIRLTKLLAEGTE